MNPIQLRKTLRIPLRCSRTATPTEIISNIEKTRQLYRCSLLEERTCIQIFDLMQKTVNRIREICQEWNEKGTRYDLNPLQDSIQELLSALQRRKSSIAENVDESISKWNYALNNLFVIKENVVKLDSSLTPGIRTFSVGYNVRR